MSETVDAQGLSCPQPVLLVLNKIRKMGSGELVVVLDAEVSKENVMRAATSRGWEVASVEEEGGVYTMTVKREA